MKESDSQISWLSTAFQNLAYNVHLEWSSNRSGSSVLVPPERGELLISGRCGFISEFCRRLLLWLAWLLQGAGNALLDIATDTIFCSIVIVSDYNHVFPDSIYKVSFSPFLFYPSQRPLNTLQSSKLSWTVNALLSEHCIAGRVYCFGKAQACHKGCTEIITMFLRAWSGWISNF